jgi:predicted CDP-diglyceride synthetase/phosphatidate cytidylyltransferase
MSWVHYFIPMHTNSRANHVAFFCIVEVGEAREFISSVQANIRTMEKSICFYIEFPLHYLLSVATLFKLQSVVYQSCW